MDPINPFSSEFCLFARCLVFRILEASCCHTLTPLKLYYRFVVCFLCQKGPITERIFSWSGTAQVLNRSYGRRGVFSQMASGNGRESQDDLPNQSNVIAAGCLDDFHMRALGSLYIGSRYVVFYLSISVCGNKQFAILIQFFNCLLRLLRFFSWVAKAMWRSEACFSYIESDGVWMPVARHSLVIMSPSTYNFALESVFLSLCEIQGSSMLIYVWIKECSPVKKKLYNENNENCTVSSYPYQQAVINVFSWKYLLGQYLYDCPITISLLGSMVPIKLYRPKKRGS